MGLLRNLRVVVCLGRIAFDGLLGWAQRCAMVGSRAGFAFAHGAEYTLPNGLAVITSYHPSLQNTNTGKLTKSMFLGVFQRARELANPAGGIPPPLRPSMPMPNRRGAAKSGHRADESHPGRKATKRGKEHEKVYT